jgi:toxin ParE1/3/4
MASFELTGAADRDLAAIYACSYWQFGRVQAESYFSSFYDCFTRLADLPDIGRSIEDLRPGYFRFAHASHVVFYVKIDNGIRIIRVLHERMEPERHL